MQRFTPYIFPLIVLAIVFFLVYRWYNMRSQPTDLASGEGIEIENLTDEDVDSIIRGTGDFQTAPLERTEDSTSEVEGVGSIRYEIKDGRVRFSVSADLPEPESPYNVWIRTAGSDNLTNAFSLELGKGGYMGTAAVSEDQLPLEVIVSQASDKNEVMNQVILKGTVEQEATEAASPSPAAAE
ncbi:MAG: hypothetical protein QG639_1120 [Patescibacteria group bacterium]|nr:hypothetical protein [Patescibacteria group bacterium]